MKIRLVRLPDRAEWVRMRDLLWPGSYEDHERETSAFFEKIDPSLATLVIERLDGGLGGFIEMSRRPYADGCVTSPVAYIEGWYVDPDLRRQGLGAALMRAGEQWARDQGLREIASDTELGNDVSITAHKSLGYNETARVVCFCKKLEPSTY